MIQAANEKLFGTDGMRGEAGTFPLDERTVRIVGASLTRQMREKLGRTPRFITGRDTRESGEWIEKAFHAGAAAMNAELASSGVITTPGVAFLTRHFDFDAGIVVSASHNPFQDNGIKIFSPSGKKIDAETERAIEQDIFAGLAFPQDGAEDLSREAEASYQTAYLDHLAAGFPGLELKNFKLVIDCANGAASHLAPRLFHGFGADIVAINDRPDGRNINHECGSLHLEKLREKVLQEHADFGVAFDGDADRALFIDENGRVVDGDAALWVLAQYLESRGELSNKTVVATVMSNIGLEIALQSRGIKLDRTAVGDKYVLEELIKSGSDLGGEQSGHIIMPRKSLVGDGMMTTLFVLEAIRERGVNFSQAVSGFTRYPQVLVNVKVREKRPFESVPAIASAAKDVETELDGDGRLLLRYSGTENLARVMIEGKDQAAIERQANELAEVIRAILA
jgi:phosphoglucosamine mutase